MSFCCATTLAASTSIRLRSSKLRSEISLQAFDLQVPMIWNKTAVRVYAGMVPLGQGSFHQIMMREGRIAHVDARDFSLKQITEQLLLRGLHPS